MIADLLTRLLNDAMRYSTYNPRRGLYNGSLVYLYHGDKGKHRTTLPFRFSLIRTYEISFLLVRLLILQRPCGMAFEC